MLICGAVSTSSISITTKEETVYVHLFVRIVLDLDAATTAPRRSCAGTAGAAGRITRCVADIESNAIARRVANTSRSNVDADIQWSEVALDWTGLHLRTHQRLRRRSKQHHAILRFGCFRRRVEDNERRHNLDTDLRQ